MMTQVEKAKRFRALHQGPEILVLPNAWDCASARIFEEAGFAALGTTSAGVAFSLGYPDRQCIPREEMMAAVGRITRSVSIPVTADLEAGYGDVAGTAAGLIESGAAGLNLEDSEGDTMLPMETVVERIRVLRRVGDEQGVPLVINARTDIYLAQVGDPASRFDRALERLIAYRDAGADCLFLPLVTEEETIRGFVEALRFPINILALEGAPDVARLRELGVARVSVGSGIARSAMGHTRRVAGELKKQGSYRGMTEGAISYGEANKLFSLV